MDPLDVKSIHITLDFRLCEIVLKGVDQRCNLDMPFALKSPQGAQMLKSTLSETENCNANWLTHENFIS